MRKYDFLWHDDVIIRLGKNDVIVDLGNVVVRCLNDVILNEGQLETSSQDAEFSLFFVFGLPSISSCFIIAIFPHNTNHRGIRGAREGRNARLKN